MTSYTPEGSALVAPVQPAARRRTGLIIALAVGAGVLLVALAVVVTLLVTRDHAAPATTPSAGAPVVNGIARPDASCVQTDGHDHQDLWNANGWWAGRVDGTEKQMAALAALSLKLGGHEVDSVWICAPRASG